MKTVADTLGVARSHLAERLSRPARPHGLYHKPEDARLLPTIRAIVDARPSYGYRRVTALVNRALRSRGEASVNAKRVLRILQANGLTLAPHTARRPGRTHDGIVVALHSNVRWCSDRLELRCRDGAVLRVLFAIDACDREIMAWSATTTGVSAEMVCDLMIACCERRFGATKTPHPVEWLSDNGSAYIAKETAQTAAALGLRLLFMPVRSPQSNGIAEAFVKTLKRDYARLTILDDAETVMRLLPGWFEDYNLQQQLGGGGSLDPPCLSCRKPLRHSYPLARETPVRAVPERVRRAAARLSRCGGKH
ncbi:transposase InsO family protein [Methylobacterium sp. R2-1]|nr:transposase InsO family protein [Methylobacterium sp. R2-1]